MAIRSKAVLTALCQRPHNGVLRAAGTDAAVKLLRSMGVRDGLIGELRERLHEMSDTGEIVIECEGNRFDMIAVPDSLENATNDTKDGEDPMIAPAGQRKTTYARDGQGRELPSHLGPQHVGPLTITYKDQAAGEATIAAADLVHEEIMKCGKTRYGRDELLAIIQSHLLPLYDNKAEVAVAMGGPVLSHLLSGGYAKRVPVPGRRNEFVIEFIVVEPVEAETATVTAAAIQELDPIEVLAQLVPELEAARQRIIELEALVEGAVSPDMFAQLIEKAEGLQAEKEELQRQLDESGTEKQGLQRKLGEAAAEKTKILAGQRDRLSKVRADHESALARLRQEHARALAAVQQKLNAANGENASLSEQLAQRQVLPQELQLRAQKLLGK